MKYIYNNKGTPNVEHRKAVFELNIKLFYLYLDDLNSNSVKLDFSFSLKADNISLESHCHWVSSDILLLPLLLLLHLRGIFKPTVPP